MIGKIVVRNAVSVITAMAERDGVRSFTETGGREAAPVRDILRRGKGWLLRKL
jgi:hypothetical protein